MPRFFFFSCDFMHGNLVQGGDENEEAVAEDAAAVDDDDVVAVPPLVVVVVFVPVGLPPDQSRVCHSYKRWGISAITIITTTLRSLEHTE